jgi:hypothetical protein
LDGNNGNLYADASQADNSLQNNPLNKYDIICEKKVCKCYGKEVYAESYSIEEYPNINWVRGQPDLNSIFGMFSIIFEGKTYYDFENDRIRTEWRKNCNYCGPAEFCSLKWKMNMISLVIEVFI